MSHRIEGASPARTGHVRDGDEPEAAGATGKREHAHKTPVEKPLTRGARALVAKTEGAKVATARRAIEPLARELAGHGVDVNRLARRWARSPLGTHRIACEARFAFVKEALTNRPELADRAIEARTRGLPASERHAVRAAAEQSGSTAFRKYAAAERALSTLQSFPPEQRRFVGNLVRIGERFEDAAAVARDEIEIARRHAPIEIERALDQKRELAARGVERRAARWQRVSRRVADTDRKIETPARAADLAVGAIAATGTVGSVLYGTAAAPFDGGKRLEDAVDRADRSCRRITGESREITEVAGRRARQLQAIHGAYQSAARQLADATRRADPRAALEAGARVERLERELEQRSKAYFDDLAPGAVRASRQFDEDATHAAVELVLKGASVGKALAENPIGSEVAKALAHEPVEAGLATEASHEIVRRE